MSGLQKTNFGAMSVAGLKKYLQERGVSVNGYLKPALIEIAVAVEKMMLPLDPNFERINSEYTMKQRLNIHDIQIDDPFNMQTKNDFIASPPFGLYDIFNYLIYNSTDYDKAGLAAYKSFEDYRLFQDGYVRSLETAYVMDAGVHVYVAKVQPSMRAKTDDGKDFYSLWFILEGRDANVGSVLDAFCKCKGGRDGGCKHISSAMYSLEELLNPVGEKSVTSGPCLWLPKPESSSEPCVVEQMEVIKVKPPSGKQVKRKYNWLQNIDFDPRHSKHQKLSHERKSRRKFTKNLSALEDKELPSSGKPVILPLLQKLYLKDKPNATWNGSDDKKSEYSNKDKTTSIMKQKLVAFMQNESDNSPEMFLNHLEFTVDEICRIEQITQDQWQSDSWYRHKVGFITASKCKDVCTRQTTLQSKDDISITALAKKIVTEQKVKVKKVPDDPQNPRDWGLKHENTARDSYLRVQKHLHYKCELVKTGFLISQKKPFLGASVDNIRRCKCVRQYKDVLAEYKCPWVHRDSNPKEAFSTKEVGGLKMGTKEYLKPNSKYYYRVQMSLFVTGLQECDFVV